MALRANRWLVTGAVTAVVLGLAGFGLGAASASDGDADGGNATPTSAATSVTPASTPGPEQATPLGGALDEPDVQAFIDCLRGQGVEVPEITDGNFSLQWQDGKLTINGTEIDLAAVGDALEACEAELPGIPSLPGLEDLEGLEDLDDLGELGKFPFGEDARQLAECMAEKGYDFPFTGPGGWLGGNADAEDLISILERTAEALRERLDAGAGSDVEQRLAALDAAIEALKADAANAPTPGSEADPGPGNPDPSGLKEALESCRAELGGD